MPKEYLNSEEKKAKVIKPETHDQEKRLSDGTETVRPIINLQKTVGNRAVQRLIAQRKGEGSYEVDDDTAQRINRERGSGQPMDEAVSKNIGGNIGYDFSGVRVHTSPEAAGLSQELSAKAFTTGQDIFFSEGSYDPHSSSGQELLAHELTHVVQQGTGAVSGTGPMRVNEPGDSFEQQADASAREALSPSSGGEIHRQEEEPEDEIVQAQEEEPEEEEIVQAQEEEPEEDEIVQAQTEEEEESAN